MFTPLRYTPIKMAPQQVSPLLKVAAKVFDGIDSTSLNEWKRLKQTHRHPITLVRHFLENNRREAALFWRDPEATQHIKDTTLYPFQYARQELTLLLQSPKTREPQGLDNSFLKSEAKRSIAQGLAQFNLSSADAHTIKHLRLRPSDYPTLLHRIPQGSDWQNPQALPSLVDALNTIHRRNVQTNRRITAAASAGGLGVGGLGAAWFAQNRQPHAPKTQRPGLPL